MKEPKSAYLIFYNNQDSYEGQDSPFAIVESEERAKQITTEITNFGNSLAAQMLYVFEDGISDEEYERRDSKNRQVMSSPWPYSWEPQSYSDFQNEYPSEDGQPQKIKFDSNTVSYKKLPLL